MGLFDDVARLDGNETEQAIYETVEQIVRIQESDDQLSCQDRYELCEETGNALIDRVDNPSSQTRLQYIHRELGDVLTEVQASSSGARLLSLEDVVLKDLDGNDVALANYFHQDKIVVFAFWASRCGPCLNEIPELNELVQNEKVSVVSLAIDTKEAMTLELKKIRAGGQEVPNYPVLIDQGREVYKHVLTNPIGIPYVAIVSPHGVLLDVKEGYTYSGPDPDRVLTKAAKKFVKKLKL